MGRTGPCAPLVADAGIRRAVIAIEDPNPLVNGRGPEVLAERGVDVTVGVLRDQAALQNERFFTSVRETAAVRDPEGRAQPRRVRRGGAGTRTQLTGPAAARFIHATARRGRRAGESASGTVLADDPVLTPRGAYRARPLSRVIFDRRLRTPPDARVLSTVAAGPVIIVQYAGRLHLRAVGRRCACRAWRSRAGGGRARSRRSADGAGRAGIASIVIEGGPTLHGAALEAGVVDLVQLYLAPRLLGAACLKWLEAGRFTSGSLPTGPCAGWMTTCWWRDMFTGLIESVGQVADIMPSATELRLGLTTSLAPELALGDSIAVNGVCLTVVSIDGDRMYADVSPETARVTAIGSLKRGSLVNLERPLRVDARIGGHFVQGHVDATGRVDEIRCEGESWWITIEYPPPSPRRSFARARSPSTGSA